MIADPPGERVDEPIMYTEEVGLIVVPSREMIGSNSGAAAVVTAGVVGCGEDGGEGGDGCCCPGGALCGS